MQAWVCRKIGSLDDLEIQEVPEPELKPGWVKIGVRATALNFPDLLNVRGLYQHKPTLPFSPGMECSGEVLDVGDGVTGFEPGDRVMAQPKGGALAEQVCARADQVYRIPQNTSFVDASGFIVAYGTSYHAYVDRGSLKSGETVLVLGAAGGVGITAIELAKLFGARVIAAASSEEKLDLCREYGADECINYSVESIRDRVMELTDGLGVDIAYDPVGGDAMFQALRSMALGGRLLILGFASGTIGDIPANRLLLRQCQAVGVAFGSYSRAFPDETRKRMNVLVDWLDCGKLKPHVSKVFSFADGRLALQMLADRKALGKVVVEFD
jgi:NADPH2:quinone reductase